MTIEEMIKDADWTIAYDEDYNPYEYLSDKAMVKLCQKVRQLTIEECKKKAKVLKIVEGVEDAVFSDDLFEIQPHYFEKYGVFQYNFVVDSKSFPTDLNNIEI